MSMRRPAKRERALQAVELRAFGWDRAAMAALRHSTLPSYETFYPSIHLDALPLADTRELGGRDRLSLVAQFAAHQALLQFAGIGDGDFDAAEWAVAQRRGTDCRLIRVAARAPNVDGPPPLTIVQQFAESIEAPPLESLKPSWGRPESVYHEAEGRLRVDAAADLRWMRRAAAGEIASPGIEALRTLLAARSGRFAIGDGSCLETVRRACALESSPALVVLGEHASPLQRRSAVAPLESLIGPLDELTDSEIAERVVREIHERRVVFAVTSPESFDAASLHVLQLLATSDGAVWIGVDGPELPASRHFVLSSRLEPRRALDERIASMPAAERSAWIESFVQSAGYLRYLDDGEVPAASGASSSLASLREPQRSYVSALALLGNVRREIAAAFLKELYFSGDLDELAVDGVLSVGDELVFATPALRDQAVRQIPAASRPSLARVAASVVTDPHQKALLLLDALLPDEAARVLEDVSGWRDADEIIATLRRFPSLTPKLARLFCEALIRNGRYRDARDAAASLTDDEREWILAQTERRTGDYAPALARLERLESGDAAVLRAELLYLLDRTAEAEAVIATCDGEAVDYVRGILAHERGEAIAWPHGRGYLAARLDTYGALQRRDFASALRFAEESLALASNAGERIDAALDRMYALFSAGRWDETRSAAMQALAMVEETQGDRAAAGILFTLAYLCADDGQWAHAAQRIARLRQFFAVTRDERRLLELELLAAHLDFSRGRFAEAAAQAQLIVRGGLSPQITEAAALILDEIDWIEKRDTPLRSTGTSKNEELTDRHRLLRVRRGGGETIGNPFLRALAASERDGTEPPTAATTSQKLMLYRSALARSLPLANDLARELDLAVTAAPPPAAHELHVLRAAATRAFPFAGHDFGDVHWRFATRNRLGVWQEIGSMPLLAAEELDRIGLHGEADWVACSDRELLYLDGLARWPEESRDALAALFRTRAEHHRLQRVVEQEESARSAAPASIEGIVGESPAMREIFAQLAKVAKRDVPVCVLGESGTGKELVARAIHRHSARKHKPFTAVNCAALPENLIESELFGHMRGAFTGADRDRAGLIETTDGGTLFLDEIGEMPVGAQAKLLRFLQEGEFRRVGDTASRTADVRIVTATNRKLEGAVEQGKFREDLYYRIRGVELLLPPLRDRAGDIALLVSHFLAQERAKHRGGPSALSNEAESIFLSYTWPGNVRELQNAIRGAHAMAGDAKEIEIEHLPDRLRRTRVVRTSISSYQDAVTRFRRDLIEKSLAQAGGNQNRAASMLKISRQALAYQIRELGILVRPRRGL